MFSATSPDPAAPSSSAAADKMTTGTAAQAGPQPAATNQGGKVKQTRRRQRLSCVECTKRRQKCDRQFPCGLCTTRGIPQLCRWEPIVVRPTPQRPPVIPTSAEGATIEALSARIAALEKALTAKNTQECQSPSQLSVKNEDATGSATSPSSPSRSQCQSRSQSLTLSHSHSPEGSVQGGSPPPTSEQDAVDTCETASPALQQTKDGPRALLDMNVQVAAVALAQLSLAPRTEYVGTGTVLCALHKLGDSESIRLPYPSSTSLTSPVNASTSLTSGFPSFDGSQHPLTSPIRDLVNKLPSPHHTEALLRLFFIERNWQFGISERWVRAALDKMRTHLDLRCPPACAGCPACKEEVNPHWLCLLFSMLALAPVPNHAAKESAKYFMAAVAARRLVDDILLASPVYSTSEGSVHGGVLSCIAAVFQATYLADRGRVSEAWKLIGSAVRSAQALGMHRDPGWGKWEKMHQIEIELRVMGWWLLIVADRIYSFVLGRPCMAPKGTFDVHTLPTDMHGDGSPNEHGLFLRPFISLVELIGEATEKCLGIHPPPYATILEMDRRFQEWESQLPPKLQWRRSSNPSSPIVHEHIPLPPVTVAEGDEKPPCPERKYAYQRNTLAGWYLCALMNIHRPYLMHPPPILPPPGSTSWTNGPPPNMNPSRERCIEIALCLTRVLTTFHNEALAWPNPGGLNAGTIAYFIFDGAVALAGALSQVPPHPQSAECLGLMDRAMRVLRDVWDASSGAGDGQGDMARRAITILRALRKAGGWDANASERERGELVSLQELLKQHRRMPQAHFSFSDGNGMQGIQSDPMSTHDHTHGFSGVSSSFNSHTAGGMENSMFAPQVPASHESSFIPFVNNSPSTHSSFSFSNTPQRTPPSMTLPSFNADFFASIPSTLPTNSNNASRLTHNMVMPFDVLQGVQSDSSMQDAAELDLAWARLAGMENWYNTAGSQSMSMDGGLVS